MSRLQQMTLAAAIALGCGAASAANVIDQNAPWPEIDMSLFSYGDIAQSFQQAAANISGAGIFLAPNWGSTDSVTISLWDKLPNETGANQLAVASGTGTAGAWFDVFWAPVSITPDTTYYLVFTGNTTLAISGFVDGYTGFAHYTRGNVFSSSGNPAALPLFAPRTEYDHAFRTYTSVATVPEPETYAMLLAGLGVLGFMGKRRRAS